MRSARMPGLPLPVLLLCGAMVAPTAASAQVAQADAYRAWRPGPFIGERIRCAGSAMCAWKRIPVDELRGFRFHVPGNGWDDLRLRIPDDSSDDSRRGR